MGDKIKNTFNNLKNGVLFIILGIASIISLHYFMPNLLTASNIMTIMLGIGLIVIIQDMIAKGETVATYLTTNVNHKMENLALFSTGTEVLGLALIALNRGMDSFNASTRYGFTGLLELMCTFLFMFFTSKLIDASINQWKAKGIKSLLGTLGRIILICILFVVCLFPTWVIALFYMESIGSLKLIFNDSLNPATMVRIVKYQFDPENPIHPELSALFMIWLNPFLNFFQIVFYLIEKSNAEQKSEEKKEDTLKDKYTNLEKALEEACKIITSSGTEALSLFNKAKSNMTSMLDINNTRCISELKSGAKTKQQIEDDWLKDIVGTHGSATSSSIGIKGYDTITRKGLLKIKNFEDDIETAAKKIDSQNHLINAESDSTKKANLTKQLETLVADKKAKDKALNDVRDIISDLRRTLEYNGFLM